MSRNYSPHPLVAYRQSDTFRFSQNGFNTAAYKAWLECYERWVLPLEQELKMLDPGMPELSASSLLKEIASTGSMVLLPQHLDKIKLITNEAL